MLFGVPLDSRNNSLNLIRLVLATSVLFYHGFSLAGLGSGPSILGDDIGGWAVIGFFALSGYLVTASRRSKPIGKFVALRAARIYPAFVVCNLFTILIVAPIAWLYQKGNLVGYGNTETTPAQYMIQNAALRMRAYDVAGTPVGIPGPQAWNGSLWSLSLEFVCYLIIAAVFLVPFASRSFVLIGLTWLGSAVARVVFVFWGDVLGLGYEVDVATKFVAYFLAGALLQMFRDSVGLHWAAALAAGTVFGLAAGLAPEWGGQVASVALAYVLLWLGATMKSPTIIHKHDVSYGMYIYAFQVQQLFAVFGAWKWGYWPFALVSLAVTILLAISSWLLVEKPIIEWVRQRLRASSVPSLSHLP